MDEKEKKERMALLRKLVRKIIAAVKAFREA